MRQAEPPPRLPGSYLVLELTNRCDLACVHCLCARKRMAQAEKGFIAPLLVRHLLEDLASSGAHFDTLILFWLGEPLLHPHFDTVYREILRANRRHGTFGKLEVHTNGLRLDAGKVRGALNASETPQVWHITLDAARPETYRRIKGRPLFHQVEANLTHLIREKARLQARWPRVVVQFILGDRNVDEASPFRFHWERTFRKVGLEIRTVAGAIPSGEDDLIFFRQLDCPTPREQERQNRVYRTGVAAMGLALPRQEAAPLALDRENHAPCSGYWKSPVIGWNGDLTLCTRDGERALRLGNLNETPFSALWWSPQMAALRRRVAGGDYTGQSLCRTCFIPQSTNYTGIQPLEILRHTRWEDNHHGLRGS